MFHGILINELHLFLSYTSWNAANEMEGPINFYCLYDSTSRIGLAKIQIFRNWMKMVESRSRDQDAAQ